LNTGAVKIIGFVVVGGTLFLLADVAPNIAIPLTLVVALGVVLARADQLIALADAFALAIGQQPQSLQNKQNKP
jgi:sensor histidine kinase regulating citrate/malate metabolism